MAHSYERLGKVTTRGQYAALAFAAILRGTEWWENEYKKMGKTAPQYRAKLSTVEHRMVRWGYEIEMSRSTKQRAMDDLCGIGLVALDGKQYHLTEHGQNVGW